MNDIEIAMSIYDGNNDYPYCDLIYKSLKFYKDYYEKIIHDEYNDKFDHDNESSDPLDKRICLRYNTTNKNFEKIEFKDLKKNDSFKLYDTNPPKLVIGSNGDSVFIAKSDAYYYNGQFTIDIY